MDSSNSTEPEVLNPTTPLAFLSPDFAFQTDHITRIIVGSLGALVWDILINLYGDYKLLFKHKVGRMTVVYFTSRIATLFYVLATAIFKTAPTGHCQKIQILIGALYPLAFPLTSLLFFFRVVNVYNHNKFIVSCFSVLWLSVLAGCLTVVFGVTGMGIGPTNYCLDSSPKSYVSAAVIIAFIYDICVFLAISWRQLSIRRVDYSTNGLAKTFVSGASLPVFYQALLRDGQTYLMITIVSNLLTVIMVYVTSVPVPYRTMLTVPNIVLANAMACSIFRDTKFGRIKPSYSSLGRSKGNSIPLSLSRPVGQHNAQRTDDTAVHLDTVHLDIKTTVDGTDNYADMDIMDPESRSHKAGLSV